MKTIDEYFRDWENHAFGFSYGTGESPVLEALKTFFATVGYDKDHPYSYQYESLEAVLGKPVTWLLINRLCQISIIEYGTSPRYAWLSEQGERLKMYIDSKSVDELYEICTGEPEDYGYCDPDYCDCGLEPKQKCPNPFWVSGSKSR